MRSKIYIFKIFEDDFAHLPNATAAEIEIFKSSGFYKKDQFEMWKQLQERF